MRMHNKALFAIATMIAATSLAAAVSPRPVTEEKAPDAETLFTQGRDALLTGDYDKAIGLLTKAVADDETKTTYRLYLARACHYAGKDTPAEKHLKQILKTTADHVEAGQLLGQIYSARQNWKDVVAVLEPLLKYRHDYTTYHMLAEAKYGLDDHKAARKYFQEAVKLNPQSAPDFYQLGNIHLACRAYSLAAEAYQKALGLGVDSPVLRYKLGSAYFNLRNYFGRVRVVTVKAGQPGTISGSWYLIEPAPGKGKKDQFRVAPSNSAIYQIAKAMADGIKDRPDIHFLKANIYLNARRYKQAYEMFGKLRKTIAKDDKALYYYYYARAAFGLDKYDEYLSLLDEAIKVDPKAYKPGRMEAFLKVAEQYNQIGRLDKYIEYLKHAVAASPQTASLHLKLGNAYEENRQGGLAAIQWRIVLDIEPDHPSRMKLINLIDKHRTTVPAKPVG